MTLDELENTHGEALDELGAKHRVSRPEFTALSRDQVDTDATYRLQIARRLGLRPELVK
jgi:hypothetical protein